MSDRFAAPDPKRWARVREIFEEVVDLDAAARKEALDRAVGEDQDLRDRVEGLLSAGDDDEETYEGFLEEPILSTASLGKPETDADGELRKIAHYEILRELGRGGMGIVYLAEDPHLKRQVAIKGLSSELTTDEASRRRLRREARMLGALNHANLASIYGLETIGERYFLVLEYVPGINLAERLEKKRLSIRSTLRTCSQIAAGLAAAHRQGMIHRDLKPANIHITPEDVVKVLDFGLAKPLASTLGSAQEGAGPVTGGDAIVGTPCYMSPEQASGKKLDARCDVWAFGCVVYECLTGRRAFEGANPWETLSAVLHTPPDWEALPPETPRQLVSLLKRCLRKDPNDRLRDLGDARLELLDTLRELDEGSAIRWATGSVEIATGERSRRRSSRFAAFACLGFLAAGLGLGFWTGRQGLLEEGGSEIAAAKRVSVRITPSIPFVSNGLPFLAVAPDGRRIVLGTRGLNVRDLSSFEEVRVDLGTAVYSPAFSPSGERLLLTQMESDTELRLFDLKDDPQRSLSLPIRSNGLSGISADWLGEDEIVYSPTWQSGLERLVLSEGETFPLTQLDEERGELSHRWPFVLPDRRGVLMTVKKEAIRTFDDASIAVLDLRTGERRELLDGGSFAQWTPGFLIYARSEGLYAVPFDDDSLRLTGNPRKLLEQPDFDPITGAAGYMMSKEGTLAYLPPLARPRREISIYRSDFQGRSEVLPLDSRFFGRIAVSPDGRRIAFIVLGASHTLWFFDLETETLRHIPQAPPNLRDIVWSEDGEKLAFAVERGGVHEILWISREGMLSPEPLLQRREMITPTSWTKDGESLVLTIQDGEDFDIWIAGPDGEAEPLSATPYQESSAVLSPDGNHIAFVSNISGSYRIYAAPFPQMEPAVEVARVNGRSMPLWLRGRGPGLILPTSSRGWREVLLDLDDGIKILQNQSIESSRPIFGQYGDFVYSISREQSTSQIDEVRLALDFSAELRRDFLPR